MMGTYWKSKPFTVKYSLLCATSAKSTLQQCTVSYTKNVYM